MNIFNESPKEACEDLNVEFKEEEYAIYKLPVKGKRETIMESGLPLSNIYHVMNAGAIWRGRCLYCPSEGVELWLTEKPDYKNNIFTVSKSGSNSTVGNFKIRIKKEAAIHKIFSY